MTPKQKRLLDFIKAHIAETGCAPSFDEMCAATGTKSKGSMHASLVRLERHGVILRGSRARQIEVIQPIGAHIEVILNRCKLSRKTRAELVALQKEARQ